MLPSTLMECLTPRRRQCPFNPEVDSRLVYGYAEPFSRTGRQKRIVARSLRSSMFAVNHPAWQSPPGTVIELPALNGHAGDVYAVAFSPDGNQNSQGMGCGQRRYGMWSTGGSCGRSTVIRIPSVLWPSLGMASAWPLPVGDNTAKIWDGFSGQVVGHPGRPFW